MNGAHEKRIPMVYIYSNEPVFILGAAKPCRERTEVSSALKRVPLASLAPLFVLSSTSLSRHFAICVSSAQGRKLKFIRSYRGPSFRTCTEHNFGIRRSMKLRTFPSRDGCRTTKSSLPCETALIEHQLLIPVPIHTDQGGHSPSLTPVLHSSRSFVVYCSSPSPWDGR